MSSVTAGEISVNIIVRTGEMQQGLSKATTAMNLFQRSASIAAGVMARDLFYAISDTAREAITLGASMDTLERSFNALAGVGSASTVSIEQLDKATMGMISRVDLLTQANRALSLGLPVDDLDKLFIGAIKLGKAMGLDATTAVEKLTLGLGRQSYRLLDDLGIVIRAGDANKIYAERLGKTVDELSAAERQTAFHTLAIEKLNEKVELLGDNIGESDKSLTQWDATIRNITVSLGEFISPLAAMVPFIQSMGPAMGIVFVNLAGSIAQAATQTAIFKGLLFDIGELGALATLGPLAALAVTIALIPTALQGYSKWMDDASGRTRELAEASNELISAQKELADATMEVNQAEAWYNSLLTTINERTSEANELMEEQAKASEKVASANKKLVDAQEKVNKATERKVEVDKEYSRVEQNLVSLIKFITGETNTYNEVLKASTYLVAGTEEAYGELEKNLSMVQMGYDRATVKVKRLTNAMDANNRTLSIQSIEQMKIRDAMQDREDASAVQIIGVENEISKLEKLAQTQGFLTFAQRKELESKKAQVEELEKAGEATASETLRLAELADTQRELEIRNAELSLKLENATKNQDKHSKKVDEAQGLIDSLITLNTTLNDVFGERETIEETIIDLTEDQQEAENELKTATDDLVIATDAYNDVLETLNNSHLQALDYLKTYNDKLKEQATLANKAAEAEENRRKILEEPYTPYVPPNLDDTPPKSEDPWMNPPPSLDPFPDIPSQDNKSSEKKYGIQIPDAGNPHTMSNSGGGVIINIENINSDNPEYIGDALQREMERRGIK